MLLLTNEIVEFFYEQCLQEKSVDEMSQLSGWVLIK